MSTEHCIISKQGNQVLVRGAENQVQHVEGNWYFHPDCIDKDKFIVSERTYHCPHKGVCNWVDLKIDNAYLNNVSWVYPRTREKYHHIAGWYGFYDNHNKYQHTECSKEK